MRLTALCTVAFLTIAGSANAADIWRLFQFEEDGFAIDFPQIPVISNQALIGDSRIRTDQYYVGIGSYTFMVTAVLFPYVSPSKSEAMRAYYDDSSIFSLRIALSTMNGQYLFEVQPPAKYMRKIVKKVPQPWRATTLLTIGSTK